MLVRREYIRILDKTGFTVIRQKRLDDPSQGPQQYGQNAAHENIRSSIQWGHGCGASQSSGTSSTHHRAAVVTWD